MLESDFLNEDNKDYELRKKILQFFLNLFRIQNDLSLQQPAEYAALFKTEYGTDHVFELRAKRDDKWISRRMAISTLGESTTSKSKCFKVTYDDILVVKIPPLPLVKFEEYIDSIDAERKIVRRLTPDIQCISPSVSSILKKIPPFSQEYVNFPEDFEQKCIELLNQQPKLQGYLQIGRTFAFFMNLSKYAFLGQVIEKLHNVKFKIQMEMKNQIDILWDLFVFESKYGYDNTHIFYNLNEIYNHYEEKINSILKEYGLLFSVPVYKKKEWFLFHLVDIKMESKNTDLEESVVTRLNAETKKIMGENHEKIEEFTAIIRKEIHDRTFNQNRLSMEGLITNVLSLVGLLRKKGVSIRDLKPDNVFVVCDLSRSSHLLTASGEYSLGLIDFETAVIAGSTAGDISQPLLGGTPAFATPSHMLDNEGIRRIYKNIALVYYLQDLQAAAGIVFYIATGVKLFDRTGKYLPVMMKRLKKGLMENKPVTAVYPPLNHEYWRRAMNEFEEKTKIHMDRLNNIEVVFPPYTAKMFGKELYKQKKLMDKEIVNSVKKQVLFKSEKSRRDLIRSAPSSVSRCCAKWESGTNIPDTDPKIRKRVVIFLKKLEGLKFLSTFLEEKGKDLSVERPRQNVGELLETMLHILVMNMDYSNCRRLLVKTEKEPATGVEEGAQPEEISSDEAKKIEKTFVYG